MSIRTLRRVQEADKELLYEWANDPITRAQSFSVKPILWEEHVAWFERKMQDSTCYHYLLEDDGVAVAVIRLDETVKNCYQVSTSVAPLERGRGYGKALFRMVFTRIFRDIPEIALLYAEVKKANKASCHCLEVNGYEHISEKYLSLLGTAIKDSDDEEVYILDVAKKPIVWIRADGNEKVGNGHLMRCLTIADACKNQRLYPIFLLADERALELVQGRGYEAEILYTDYKDMIQEIPVLGKFANFTGTVLCDSYFLTKEYIRALRQLGTRVAVMDDMGENPISEADLCINYQNYAEKLLREKKHINPNDMEHYLLGNKYAPIRPSFCNEDYAVRDEVDKILITTGASDPQRAGVRISRMLQEGGYTGRICVVCGPYCDSVEELTGLGVDVQKGLTDLSELMRSCDLAIAATGSTLLELCAVGVPTIPYYFADNQKMGHDAFCEMFCMDGLGDLRKNPDLQEKYEDVARLYEAKERCCISEKERKLVDGLGAIRISHKLRELI